MAKSMIFRTSKDFCTRFAPISPSSSMPAVSMTMHGPMPKISMDLRTGSVVVPAVLSTIATSCPVMALMRELLPLFLRPKMPMCGLLSLPFIWRQKYKKTGNVTVLRCYPLSLCSHFINIFLFGVSFFYIFAAVF